jgi:fatty acid desaturase
MDEAAPGDAPQTGDSSGRSGPGDGLPEPLSAAAGLDSQHYGEARRLLVRAFSDERGPALRIFLACYGLTLAPVALSVALCAAHPAVWTFLLGALVIGVAQNGLGLLMHEGSHGFFHADRKINDLLCNALVCLPIFNTVAGYRGEHFDHHRYSGTPRDPYRPLYGEYRSRGHLALCLLGDLALVSAVAKFAGRYGGRNGAQAGAAGPAWVAALVATQASLFVILGAATGWWGAYFALWLLPAMTVAQVINRVRTIAEHAGRPGVETNRGTAPGWIEYLLIAPYGYSFHFEHHLAPSIPYYRLGGAHRLLRESGFAFSDREETGGYLRCFLRAAGSIGPGS